MTPTGATSATGPAKPRSGIKELTVRGIILGGLITLIFTAANVYLGLKVGLTFATSIPAAVISMAILRKFQDHSVQENNIVQTIASAAGTLSGEEPDVRHADRRADAGEDESDLAHKLISTVVFHRSSSPLSFEAAASLRERLEMCLEVPQNRRFPGDFVALYA